MGPDYGCNEVKVQGVTGSFTRQDESILLELIGVVLRMWKGLPLHGGLTLFSMLLPVADTRSSYADGQAVLDMYSWETTIVPIAGQSTRLLFFLHKGVSWELFIGKGIRPQNPLTKNIGCGSLCPSHDLSGYNQLTWGLSRWK